MGTLTRAPTCYVYRDTARERGEALGLTLSTHPDAVSPGEYTFYTSDRVRGKTVPTLNPYAVLPLYREADDTAAIDLLDMWLNYEESLGTSCSVEYPAPPGLAYLPYQRAGIAYALKRPHVLIGDEPGLGKTIQAIGVANAVDAKRILVVCPASVRLQWAAEVARWRLRPSSLLASGERRIHTVLASRDGIDPAAGVTIASYQFAASPGYAEALAKLHWDLVVFDEAHYLKNYSANRTRKLLGSWGGDYEERPGVVQNAERILALTGTPLPNRPRECYTLARALDWDAIGQMSEDHFMRRFNPTTTLSNGFRLETTERLLELQARLRSRFMVRRAKAAVLQDLPDKRYELAFIEPDGAVRKVLKAERMLNLDPEMIHTSDPALQGAIATVRREMGRAKAPGVKAHIDMLLDGGLTKLVVFAYHTEVIRYLMDQYEKAAVVIHGGTSPVAREAAKARFQDDPECKIFIGQLTAAGTGVDGLQNVCSHAVFAEASWVPGENEQCIDRLHRIGQRSGVIGQFLVAPGSLDERILGSAIGKARTIHSALDADMTA